MSLTKLYLQVVAISLAVLLAAATAFAVEATGEGIDRQQALNSALRTAVEMQIGTAVASDSIVDSGVLVRDEIASHSKGYVASYKVLQEGATADGYAITIDAVVDSELMYSDYTTLAILQKMSGLPRLLIFGSGAGFDSVPPESMKELVHDVSRTFSEKFQFEVIDWPMARARYSEIEGSMNLKKAAKYNGLIKAEYVVAVDLELPRNANPVMHMTCVRISDGLKLGEVRRPLEQYVSLSGKPSEVYRRAVEAAKPETYWASVRVARELLQNMESELDRGKGFRYSLTFLGFPELPSVSTALEEVPGFVRKEITRQNGMNMEVTYWSTLRAENLFKRISTALKNEGVVKFQSRMEGRNMRFRWQNPEGF
ncbi:hypothetical protein [Maridesulfovibrio sp.]|uniref:hypothetical protein n=1 Tax=Maridesulfovibrio sp. TaxID=2795000 RepID=UPI0039EEBBAE